ATKAGLVSFAESLAYELDGHDVRVSVIVPGVIDTPFFDRRGRPYGRKRPGPQPPERVARAIVSGLERDRDVSYVPRWMRLPAWLHGAAPGTFRALATRFGDPGWEGGLPAWLTRWPAPAPANAPLAGRAPRKARRQPPGHPQAHR